LRHVADAYRLKRPQFRNVVI